MKPHHKNRSRAYARHQRQRVIQRKTKIAIKKYDWIPDKPGRYAKGKVHCSCYWCSDKTRSHGYPHSNVMQFLRMDQQVRDYFNDDY